MAEGLLRSNKTRDGIAAILADNLGYMEEDIWERQQQWAAEQQKFRDMEAALEQGGLRVLAKPNLLKQNWWTNSSVGHNVVHGNDSRIGGTSYPYLKSYNEPTLHELQSPPTAAQLAEACAYYTYTEDGVTHYNLYKDEDDIRATVVDLAAADQISEMDGEVYTKAINFAITANSAYGNSEWLCYCNPSTTQKYTAGTTPKAYGQIEELIPGEIYTMSFWARVLSGEGAWMRCAWGGRYGQIYESEGYCHLSDWIEIKGAIWQRYTWRFKYDPTGDWYSETSAVEDGVTKITRIYNWLKRVAFGIARKFDAVVQVCGFRLVKGRLWISETYDGLEDGINANASAIENLKDADGDIMANLAEAEEVTAKVNHAAGEVFVIGNKMYRATVAIAAGETIEVGTNCEVKTIEEYFAPKQNPNFTGSVSMGRRDIDYIGPSSTGLGNVVIASGYYSQAMGNWTTAQRKSQFVFGEFNDPDQSGTYGTRGNYVEIVGNGSMSKRSNARTLDWNGNEVLAGKLTVGAGPSADMDAATKKYVDDENAGKILIDLPNVNMGIGMFQTYTPFEAQKYRITKITIDNRYAISNLKAKTGKDNASRSFILIQATVDQAAIYTNPYRHITLELERIHKSYNADWSENELNGFETALD